LQRFWCRYVFLGADKHCSKLLKVCQNDQEESQKDLQEIHQRGQQDKQEFITRGALVRGRARQMLLGHGYQLKLPESLHICKSILSPFLYKI